MMPPTESILIWISVPNVASQAWSNAAYSQDFRESPCMTDGLPIGITQISGMQSAAPIYSVN